MKRKTSAFSLLLTLAAFLLPLALLTEPARAAWEGDGDGSAADPYQISDVSELVTFRELVNDDEPNAYAVLTDDIDLNGSEISIWTPIGCDDGHRFSGVFDGQGHTVKGLYVDGGLEYAGLFGCVGSGGTVKNLNVEGTVKNARAGGKAGGVVGYNKGTVENCRSAGTVSGGSSVGGVVGENSGTVENIGTVESCRNTGTVSGTNNVGGVVGDNTGAAPTVKNCCNTGTVSGESDSITPSTGGVVGYVGGGSPVVENCYNTGAVSSKSSSGNPGTGGVVGYVAGNKPVVENCCNTGKVSGESAGARIGGVVGCVSGAPEVKNCYNGGTVPDSGNNGVVGHKDSGDMSGVQVFNGSLTAAQFADADSFPAEWFSEDGAWRMGAARPLLKAFDNATAGTWAELADALRWDGTVTLTADVTAGNSDGDLVVPAGADVTLDLNDHYVLYTGTGSSPVITLDGGALTLADRAPEKTARFVTLGENGRATAVAKSGTAGDGCLAVTGGLIAGGTGLDGSYGTLGGGVYVDADGTFTMNGGTICGNAVTSGGGVYSNCGTFNMKGGTITGNAATGIGGGVYSYYSTFNMTAGTISGNAATDGGGVYVLEGSFTMSGTASITGNSATGDGGGVYVIYADTTFNMAGGTITDCNASSEGGGVYLNEGAFDMTGGTVSGNTASNGGGVYVNDGTFTMTGGTITGCKAQYSEEGSGNGGGVYVADNRSTPSVAKFTMAGGTISDCNASDSGGGVYVYSGPFTMTGGTIANNIADNGGGVCIGDNNTSTVTMTGGTISGNTAGDGGGVYVGCCSAFTVSGAPVIKDNQKTNSQNADNVAFYGNSIDDGKITVGALTDGACIYVNSMDNVDKDGSNCITVGNALLASSLTGGTVTAPANSLLVCATYKDGRMTGVQTVTLAENCIGKAASELLTVPTNGQYKLFLLDGKTYAPLCAAWDSARE